MHRGVPPEPPVTLVTGDLTKIKLGFSQHSALGKLFRAFATRGIREEAEIRRFVDHSR